MSEHGTLETPAGWELRTQAIWYEPERNDLGARMAVNKVAQARASIVVNRSAGRGASAAEVEASAIREMLGLMPMLRRLSQQPVRFADGVDGLVTQLAVPTGPQLRLLQAHLFRVDAGIATQIVVSVEESRKSSLESELLPIALSFRP